MKRGTGKYVLAGIVNPRALLPQGLAKLRNHWGNQKVSTNKGWQSEKSSGAGSRVTWQFSGRESIVSCGVMYEKMCRKFKETEAKRRNNFSVRERNKYFPGVVFLYWIINCCDRRIFFARFNPIFKFLAFLTIAIKFLCVFGAAGRIIYSKLSPINELLHSNTPKRVKLVCRRGRTLNFARSRSSLNISQFIRFFVTCKSYRSFVLVFSSKSTLGT